MKRYTKIISVLLIALMLVSIATSVFGFTPKNVSADINGTNTIQNIGTRIMGIIQIVGTIVSVVILVVLGIKYMMGSAEEKAEYKKTMIPYIIGAVLIFAAANIANMVYTWANTIST